MYNKNFDPRRLSKIFMLTSAIAFGFTSCKDDEDEIPIPDHKVTFFASSQMIQ
jgi:hypothetical protein